MEYSRPVFCQQIVNVLSVFLAWSTTGWHRTHQVTIIIASVCIGVILTILISAADVKTSFGSTMHISKRGCSVIVVFVLSHCSLTSAVLHSALTDISLPEVQSSERSMSGTSRIYFYCYFHICLSLDSSWSLCKVEIGNASHRLDGTVSLMHTELSSESREQPIAAHWLQCIEDKEEDASNEDCDWDKTQHRLVWIEKRHTHVWRSLN